MICLGAVIRGDTPHFDYISAEASRGIGQAALDSDVPIIFGVLTTHTIAQAIERAESAKVQSWWRRGQVRDRNGDGHASVTGRADKDRSQRLSGHQDAGRENDASFCQPGLSLRPCQASIL